MNSYFWSCQACEGENPGGVDTCRNCGCPAQISAVELKAFKRYGKIVVPTKDFDFPGYETICRREVKAVSIGLYIIALVVALLSTPKISWGEGLGIVLCSAYGFHVLYAFIFGYTIYFRTNNLEPGRHKVFRLMMLPVGPFLLLFSLGVISGAAG